MIHEGEARQASLDAAIARGLADAEAGRTAPAATVFDRLEGKYRAMAAGRGKVDPIERSPCPPDMAGQRGALLAVQSSPG